MGSIDERHPEYREALRLSTYPFVPSATLINELGRFIPREAFVDACLHPLGVTERLFISSIALDGATITLTISTETLSEVCTTSWSSLVAPPDVLELQDQYGRPAGTIITEPTYLRVVHAWGVGTYTFELEQTEFCSACLLPQPAAGVSAFRLASGETVSNKVWLVGGIGVRLSVREVDGRPIVRVDALGEPLYQRRLCTEPGLYEPPRPVRKLRIESSAGNFVLRPNAMGAVRLSIGRHLTDRPALRIERTPGVLYVYMLGEREDQA